MEKLSHLLKRVKLRQSIEPEGSSAQHAQILGMEGSGRWIFMCVCFNLTLCWVFVAAWAFLYCSVLASHCGDFSCGGTLALGRENLSIWGMWASGVATPRL